MRVLPFIFFNAIFAALCSLYFVAAGWALKKLRDPGPGEIDLEYTRMEDFEAHQVRTGHTFANVRSASYIAPPGPSRAGVIHVSGDCLLTEKSVVRGVVAEGGLILRDGALVEQFADSEGQMLVGRNCVIRGPATSATAISLDLSCRLGSACAPEVTTTGAVSAPAPGAVTTSQVSIPGEMRGVVLHQMSADTWICRGDLHLDQPLLLQSKLIVMGSFSAPAGSQLLHDVKASGDIQIGAGSLCRGKLVCGGNLTLGEFTRFEQVVHVGGELHMGRGVRGEGSGPVAAYAAGRVTLGEGILIRGKVASDLEVLVEA